MKKYLQTSILAFFVSSCFAQKSYHHFFIGSNLTAADYDSKTIIFNHSKYENFKNSKIGFNIGYKHIFQLNKSLSLSGGIQLMTITSEFSRSHYSNFIAGDPRSVFEKLKLTRVSVPIQGYYNFIKTEKLQFYFTAGTGIIFINRVNRTADYYIPTPPSGYAQNTFKGKQSIKFGEKSSSIGLNLFGGIGSEFEIKQRNFTIELSYSNDISKNKFLTLHNIEDDSYFFTKFKSFELTVGHTFSWRRKK